MVGFRRSLAVIMAATVLFWSAFPSISLAFFITPGQAIQYGTPIKGGNPMTGGQFMVPGNVYETGNALNGGQTGANGQIIIPAPQTGVLGQFILPNIINSPKYDFLITGDAMTTGDVMTGGDASSNGNAVESGEAAKGGEGSANGDALQGGDAGANGDAVEGGDASTNGDALKGGEASTNGDSLNGGDAANGGEAGSGGDTLTGGESGADGQTPVPGDAGSNGDSLNGGKADSNGKVPSGEVQVPSPVNVLFPFTDTSRGETGIINGILVASKDYITSATRQILEGATATYAGFSFRELSSGNYKVVEKRPIKSKFFNHFYDNFKKYDLNGREAYMKPGGANPRPYKVDSFIKSKNFTDWRGTPKSFISTTWNGVKEGLKESFNPLSMKNAIRLNGPVNILTSSVNTIYDYGWGEKKGGSTSDFAADLTVDVAIGAGTTILSSAASSMAAGALAGSVFPGVGTLVGAVAGLAVGIGANLLINGTGPGVRAKEWVSGKLSQGYSWLGKQAKGLWGKLGFGS